MIHVDTYSYSYDHGTRRTRTVQRAYSIAESSRRCRPGSEDLFSFDFDRRSARTRACSAYSCSAAS